MLSMPRLYFPWGQRPGLALHVSSVSAHSHSASPLITGERIFVNREPSFVGTFDWQPNNESFTSSKQNSICVSKFEFRDCKPPIHRSSFLFSFLACLHNALNIFELAFNLYKLGDFALKKIFKIFGFCWIFGRSDNNLGLNAQQWLKTAAHFCALQLTIVSSTPSGLSRTIPESRC